MNRTPLLILKQDAREDFEDYTDRYVHETNQRRKKCLQILKVNHIMICYSILMISKIKEYSPWNDSIYFSIFTCTPTCMTLCSDRVFQCTC